MVSITWRHHLINLTPSDMGLLPDTQTCGLRMHRVGRERFPCHYGLAIPTCITARASCRDRKLAISFEVGGGENVPGIPGTCATHIFAYLVRGQCFIQLHNTPDAPNSILLKTPLLVTGICVMIPKTLIGTGNDTCRKSHDLRFIIFKLM